MATTENVIDMITRQVREQVVAELAGRAEHVVADVQAEAQRRIDAALVAIQAPSPYATGGIITTGYASAELKTDARSRAARTAIQGGIYSIVVAVCLAIAGLVNGGIDLTSAAGWRTLAVAVGGAAFTAATAYIQRFTSPPKSNAGGR